MVDHDAKTAYWKLTIAWIGTVFGGVTLSDVALTLTIVYTILQIYKLARDLWRDQSRRG